MISEVGAHWHCKLANLGVVCATFKRINHIENSEISEVSAVAFVKTAIHRGVAC